MMRKGDVDMLAALCVAEQSPHRQKKRLWRRRREESVRSEFVQAGSGRFLRLTALPGRDGALDWAEIRRLAGGEAGRLLMPRGILPPEGMGIRPFRGVALQRELMLSTALHLLRTASIPPRHVRIGIYDPNALIPQLAAVFLPYAADVRLVTARTEAYAVQEQLAMDNYGAALPLSREPETLNGSTLLLAPQGIGHLRPRVRGLILSGIPEIHPGVVGGYVPQASSACLAALPQGCDAWEFLSGLYECSGMRELVRRPPALLYINGHSVTMRDAAWKLTGLDIGISV